MNKDIKNIELNIELALGGQLRICARCNKAFVQYRRGTRQKLCPTCVDARDSRPSIVVERELLTQFAGVRVVSLPGSWHSFIADPKDEGCYRITVSGKQYGASWSGRIVLYAQRPIELGEVVRLRHMRASHKVKAIYTEKTTSPFVVAKGGPSSITRRTRLPITADNPEAVVEAENYEYVVLEPMSGKTATYDLVWDKAATKTTLKGLGRQYWAKIGGAPLWEMRVRGGYRSGRASTTGILAVVDKDHPLIVTGTGDIKYTRRWPSDVAP